MKAIVNTAPGKLELLEWPMPQPGPGQVRIQTRACGICATELKMIDGWQRTGFPSIPGHEWSGRVDAVGEGVEPGLIGRYCVAENVLSDGDEVGFEHPGGYGEYFLTEARNLYPLPEDFPAHFAVLIEPLSVCVRGVRRLRVEAPEKPALIFGDGPIGLLMLLLLRHAGMEDVMMVGGKPDRLALASELGAQRVVLAPRGEDPTTELKEALGKEFAYVIEASGSPVAMRTSLYMAQRGGRVLVLGDYDEARADFEWNDLLHREIELVGSNAGAGAWAEAVRLAVQRSLPLERLVTHRFPFYRFAEAISLARNREKGLIKAVLMWEENK